MTVISVYVPLSLSIEDRKKMINSFKAIGWEDGGIISNGKRDNSIPPKPIIAAYKFLWNRFEEYTLPDNLPKDYHIEFLEM